MRRILFYLFIAVQIVFLLFLMFQFERGYNEGRTIKLKTTVPEHFLEEEFYQEVVHGTLYVEYEVAKIPEDKWNKEDTLKYNDPVYILLEENEAGIYDVVAGSSSKLTPSDHQVMLRASYDYFDEEFKFHRVRYEIESIENIEKYGTIRHQDELVVTIVIGKWGQRDIKHVEKFE